jgi:hypothetical protein
MIIWITGQHNAGKTTLATKLTEAFRRQGKRAVHLDGDAWRTLAQNIDYSVEGRRNNIRQAMAVALLLDDSDSMTICSFISPYRDQREWLKETADVLEVYVLTVRSTQSPEKLCPDYEPPRTCYVPVLSDVPSRTDEAVELIIYECCRRLDLANGWVSLIADNI